MNGSPRRTTLRAALAAALSVLFLGSAALTAGLIAAPPAGSTPPPGSVVPPWEPDAGSVGGLTFYNSLGQPVTGGSINASPVAAYVQGANVVNTLDTRATLYGYLPVKGQSPGEFSGEALGASTLFPNSSAPAPLNASTLPLETGAAGDETVAQLMSDFPNTDTSSDGYANMYVLRLKTSRPGSNNTTYDSADIEITGSTWSVAYGDVTQDYYSASPPSAKATVSFAFTIPSITCTKAELKVAATNAVTTYLEGTPTSLVSFPGESVTVLEACPRNGSGTTKPTYSGSINLDDSVTPAAATLKPGSTAKVVMAASASGQTLTVTDAASSVDLTGTLPVGLTSTSIRMGYQVQNTPFPAFATVSYSGITVNKSAFGSLKPVSFSAIAGTTLSALTGGNHFTIADGA